MVNWQFNPNDYSEQSFTVIPVGEHRVRIEKAEEAISQAGNQMIRMVLEVSGYNGKIFHNFVFMQDNQKLTNQKLGELFNSFSIQPGNLNIASWIGKVGAAKVKHENYNGEISPKVNYFISKDRQDKLPAWVEPSNKAELTGQATPTPVPTPSNLPWA